ncbi:MAG: NAD(P)-binding protein, partial [Nanoarchaeota archaeon]|nr:NAD(P)-binding protein [Nanoarchaeota archaeon]
MRTYDAIVIGTGLGGLSIAALLSNDNYKVLCLEKNKDVGGRARIMKKDGFTYEYGIHVLRYGPKGACAKILKKTGIEDLEIKKLNVAIYDDKKFHNFSSGGLASLINMGLLNKTEKAKFLKEIISLGYGNIDHLYDTSVLELMEKRGYSENLKKVFSSMSTSMLSCPDTSKASAGELAHHLKNVVSKRYAVGYPKGGFETIISHLTNKITEKNELLLETKVRELIRSQDKIVGVDTEK